MTKLTDTQEIILANASQTFDGNVLPLPGSLRGGAQTKVVDSLLKKGLIEERTIDRITPPDASLNHVWRHGDDGRAILLYITKAGLEAIGCGGEGEGADTPDADDAPSAATGAGRAVRKSKAAPKPRARGKAAQAARRATDGAKVTKQDQLIALLRRPQGAAISEISAAFGWLPHTTRGAISGALKKKLGLDVVSERIDGRGTVYKLPA